ncbi:MAG: hypothetical protein WKF87_17040 [Chryseolinea sp.]
MQLHKHTSAAVDLDRIKQKKVKKFINALGLHTSSDFVKLQSAGYNASHESTYHTHRKTFLVRRCVDQVWEAYKTIHPRDAWKGNMVSFGVQYSTQKDKIIYLHDEYAGMEVGQIIILNLELFWGVMNIAVAHQVVELDEEKRLIKLSYMAGGASEGSQWITMHPTKDGFTEVLHHTLYKSGSNFRDKTLYPGLHTKAISEFHRSVKRLAELKPE